MKQELLEAQEEAVRIFALESHRTHSIQTSFGSISKFVRLVYEKHEEQIERWGDWSVVHHVEDVVSVHANTARSAWNDLNRWGLCTVWKPLVHPGVFSKQIWEKEDAAVEVLPGRFVKFRKGQAVSRAVLKCVKNPEEERLWQMYFTKLGDLWAALTESKLEISAAPVSFLRLGHMGENSCYRTGGGYETSKFHLAQLPGSFVGLLYKRPTSLEPDGRFWGVAGEDGAIVTNHYRFAWRAYQSSIRHALEKEFGGKLSVRKIGRDSGPLGRLHAYWAYVNAGPKILTLPKKKEEVLEQVTSRIDQFLQAPVRFRVAY